MMLRNTTTHYGAIARLFHWLTVLLIVAQFVSMEFAHDLPRGPERSELYRLHKSLGVSILLLAIARLAWRFGNPVPPAPVDARAWERRAADVSHRLLYALIFALPLTGWVMSAAGGRTVEWFGLVALPNPVGANAVLDERLEDVHEALANALLVVASVHVLAALRHHFVLKDDVLRRMAPWSGR